MVPVNNSSTVSSAISVLGELSPGGILMHGTSQQQLNRKFCFNCVRGNCLPGVYYCMVPVNNNSTVSSAISVLRELSPGGILMHGTSQQQLNRKFCYKCVRGTVSRGILMNGTSQQQLNCKFCYKCVKGTVSRGCIDAWYQSTTAQP